ncbi:hypothetical protein [Microbacterium suwonense]|uniref:DUF3592 domain-containing protein n=1 Tax=Microbacterium suwonense TaxID=683047 RepID=A0ABM8FQ44_9MICO|nr:hypothetical protein [Microbacterium suwonense]BDZ37570.1 hypothetical protein GCM10025863_01840 [Microbacterium suwonense]
MSLVDPQSRWWNRDSTRRRLAYVCYTLSFVLAAVSMGHVMAGEASVLPDWVSFITIAPLPLMLAGSFLIAFGTTGDMDSRFIVWPLAGLFIALGAGAVAGGAVSPGGLKWWHLQFVVFAAGGVVAIIVSILLRRRAQRNDAVRKVAERSRVVATGVVTRARGYSVNYRRVTKVTVKFTDQDGNTRWSSDTIAGEITTGQRMRVQYAPDHLGNKAAVILTRNGSL